MEVTIEQALQKSLAAHREGNLQEAERLYRIILQSEPLHPSVNHNLGVLAVSVNKTEAALPLFKIALESNPKIEQFWLSYIDALLKEKQLSTLKKVIEQARKQDISAEKLDIYESQLAALASESKPENIKRKEGQKQEGKVETPSEAELVELIKYYKAGNFSDTEKLALSLTKRFPKHHIAWKVLGVVLQETGRTRDSLVASQQSVQLGPQDPEAHNNLGLRLAELRRFEEAAESFKQVIALKPDYAPAHCNLGASLQELGTLEEAEISFRQAIALDPKMGRAYLCLSYILRQLGHLDESSQLHIKGLKLTSVHTVSNSNLETVIPKFVKKIQQQDGIPTFFDNSVSLHLTNKPDSAIDFCGVFEAGQSSKENRFVSFSERVTTIPASMPSGRLFDGLPFNSSQGIHSLIKWKEHSLYKTSFDLVLYWMIMQNVKPDIIIELGSGDGGSAIWLADMACALGLDTHVYSYDINKPKLNHERVTFIEYDLLKIGQHSKPPCWEFFLGKKILIEDAHVNVKNVLTTFDNVLSKDDYLIIEDSDSKQEIIRDFAGKREPKYKLDQFFLDFFGTNITCSKNSIFKVS